MEMSMRKIVSLMALVALTGCTGIDDVLVEDGEHGEVQATWATTLTGFPIRPSAAGTATFDQHTSVVAAEGAFTGLLPNTFYHWKLYFGTCTARLQQVGPNANPPALAFFTTDGTGRGSATGLIVNRLKPDSAYNVRVFTAAQPVSANDTVVYACGNLTRQ
jgi:hypothetical protein